MRVLRVAPREVEDVRLEVLPALAEVLRSVELLVDLARLAVAEVGAARPASGESPVALPRVEDELVDLLAGVQRPQVRATVLSDPINAVTTCKILVNI